MIEIFECPQGSDAWYQCRLGLATSSEFATVMAKGRGKEPSKTRRTYLMKLAGEILTGEPMYSYSNDHMERGKVMEAEARALYAMMTDAELTQVGFIRNGRQGCSPDSMIGENGLLEVKTRLAHLQLELLLADTVPPEHMAQLQGQLWVAEREWVDFCSYWPKLDLFAKRVYRDEAHIALIATAVERFNAELDAIVSRFAVHEQAA